MKLTAVDESRVHPLDGAKPSQAFRRVPAPRCQGSLGPKILRKATIRAVHRRSTRDTVCWTNAFRETSASACVPRLNENSGEQASNGARQTTNFRPAATQAGKRSPGVRRPCNPSGPFHRAQGSLGRRYLLVPVCFNRADFLTPRDERDLSWTERRGADRTQRRPERATPAAA
jgi:hypothetical protein